MRGIALLVVGALVLVSFGCGSAKAQPGMQSIRYLPFQIPSERPITRAAIVDVSSKEASFSTEPPDFVDMLRVIKNAAPGPFDERAVRAQIRLASGDLVYIDESGGVWINGSTRRLKAGEFKTVQTVLDFLTCPQPGKSMVGERIRVGRE